MLAHMSSNEVRAQILVVTNNVSRAARKKEAVTVAQVEAVEMIVGLLHH